MSRRLGFNMTDVRALIAGTESDVAEVVSEAMSEAGDLLKGDWRAAIEAAGLGSRLARTVQSRAFPDHGISLDPAAWVWTKAPKIIDAFDRGATIRARNRKWIAFQTPAAGRARVTPMQWERKTGLQLRFVALRGGTSAILVADNARLSSSGQARRNAGSSRAGGAYTRLSGRTTVIVFRLFRSVALKKRFDLTSIAAQGGSRLPGLVSKHWSKIRDRRSAPMLMDDNGRPLARTPLRQPPPGFKGW